MVDDRKDPAWRGLQERRDDRQREADLESRGIEHHPHRHLQPSDRCPDHGGLFLAAGSHQDEQADNAKPES